MANKTWYIDREKNRITGNIEDYEALKQSVYDMLTTQRYAHLIYSTDYGSNNEFYIGKDKALVVGDIGREIKETLMVDDRITDVKDFKFGEMKSDSITVDFVVDTIYGELEMGIKL